MFDMDMVDMDMVNMDMLKMDIDNHFITALVTWPEC